MYIKKVNDKHKNGNAYNLYYLCDEKNEIQVFGSEKALNMLAGFELGSYDYLFNEEMLFEWGKRSTRLSLSDRLEDNPMAWVREIKINDLLADD
jgi:hypothetical protein